MFISVVQKLLGKQLWLKNRSGGSPRLRRCCYEPMQLYIVEDSAILLTAVTVLELKVSERKVRKVTAWGSLDQWQSNCDLCKCSLSDSGRALDLFLYGSISIGRMDSQSRYTRPEYCDLAASLYWDHQFMLLRVSVKGRMHPCLHICWPLHAHLCCNLMWNCNGF